MFKYLLTAITISLFTLLGSPAFAQTKECYTISKFLQDKNGMVRKLYRLPTQDIKEFEDAINTLRKNFDKEPFQVSGLYSAMLVDGRYGLVYFDVNECIYPESVVVLNVLQYKALIETAFPVLQKLKEVPDGSI